MLPYTNVIKEWEQELASINLEAASLFPEIHTGIYACKLALDKLRALLQANGFNNLDEECYFFKNIKPKVVGQLIFFIKLAAFEKSNPLCDKKLLKKHIKNKLLALQSFYLANQEFYSYQLQERTDRDKEYFTRVNGQIDFHSNAILYCTDSNFSTSHDLLAAKFIAHQMLLDYYSKKLSSLSYRAFKKPKKSNLKWTGLKVDLVELVYALQASGLVNNGNAPIKDLAEAFEAIFTIKLGDYYRTFLEIRTRKNKSPNLFQTLQSSLQRKIIDLDQ